MTKNNDNSDNYRYIDLTVCEIKNNSSWGFKGRTRFKDISPNSQNHNQCYCASTND